MHNYFPDFDFNFFFLVGIIYMLLKCQNNEMLEILPSGTVKSLSMNSITRCLI